MKIDGVDPLKNRLVEKSKESKPASGESFKEILEGLSGAEKALDASKPSGLSPVSKVPFITPQPGALSEEAVINRLEGILTDFSMFANALKNEDMPIERLAPIVEELTERKDELAQMVGSMPEGELKDLASEALSTLIEHLSMYHTGYTH